MAQSQVVPDILTDEQISSITPDILTDAQISGKVPDVLSDEEIGVKEKKNWVVEGLKGTIQDVGALPFELLNLSHSPGGALYPTVQSTLYANTLQELTKPRATIPFPSFTLRGIEQSYIEPSVADVGLAAFYGIQALGGVTQAVTYNRALRNYLLETIDPRLPSFIKGRMGAIDTTAVKETQPTTVSPPSQGEVVPTTNIPQKILGEEKVYVTYRVVDRKGVETMKGTAHVSPDMVAMLSKKPNVEIVNVSQIKPLLTEYKVVPTHAEELVPYKPIYKSALNEETNQVEEIPYTKVPSPEPILEFKSNKESKLKNVKPILTQKQIEEEVKLLKEYGFMDEPAEEYLKDTFDIKSISLSEKKQLRGAYRVKKVALNGEIKSLVEAPSSVLSNLIKGQRYLELIPTKLPPKLPPLPSKVLPPLSPPPILLLSKGTVKSYFDINDELVVPNTVNYKHKRLMDEIKTFSGASRESLVRRSGEPGELLIHEIKRASLIPYLKSGDFNDELNQLIVKNGVYKREEWQNLQDTLQGRAQPLSQKVSNAYIVFDRQRKTIESLRRSQDPSFSGLTNYFHHDIPSLSELKNTNVRIDVVEDMVRRGVVQNMDEGMQMIDEWINKVENDTPASNIHDYLIKKGYAKDENEAAYLLNNIIKRYRGFKYGAFEPRTADLPFYRPNPFPVMATYNEEALRHLYNSERFGEKAEKLWHLVDKIGESGVGKEVAQTLVDLFTGKVDQSSTVHLTRLMLDSQVVQRMSLSAVGNYFQGLTGSALRADLWDTLKSFGEARKNLSAAHQFAARAGQHPEYKTFFAEGAGSIARKFLKMTQFTKTEVDNYFRGVMAGKTYALDQFAVLQKNPSNRKAVDNLLKMGMSAPDITVAMQRGWLSDEQLRIAGTIVWREGQSIPTIWNQPQRWLGMPLTSDSGKLAYQFKSVAFPQVGLFWNYGVKKAMKGDWSAILTLLLLFPAVGEIIEDIQDTIAGRGRPKGLLLRYLDNMQGAFAWGIIDDIFYMAQSGLSFTVGPALQQVGQMASGSLQLLKGKSPTGLKQQLRGIPFVGGAIYESVKGKNSTSRTRTGRKRR